MVQYLTDDRGILIAGDDVHGRTNAVRAGCAGTVKSTGSKMTYMDALMPRAQDAQGYAEHPLTHGLLRQHFIH